MIKLKSCSLCNDPKNLKLDLSPRSKVSPQVKSWTTNTLKLWPPFLPTPLSSTKSCSDTDEQLVKLKIGFNVESPKRLIRDLDPAGAGGDSVVVPGLPAQLLCLLPGQI